MRKQRTMFQRKELDKTSEEKYIYIYTYEKEIRNLPAKAFKAMIIKVLTQLRRKGEHSDIKIV